MILLIVFLPLLAAIVAGLGNRALGNTVTKSLTTGALFVSAALSWVTFTGYLGGATEVHVRAGEPYFFPIIIGVVMWVGYALRRPDVIKGAFGRG